MSRLARARRIRLVRLLLCVAIAALGLLAISLVAVAAPWPGGSSVSSSPAKEASVSAKTSRHSKARGRRGRQGRRGHRGARGGVGTQGPVGPQGPQGLQGQQGSPIIRQPISIGWQNNAWQGQATQEFVAPGIGTGNVTCKPPYENGPTNREPNGTQWVRFFPYDSTASVAQTVMPTTRFGGPPADKDTAVLRTAKLLNPDFGPDFYEGMNTQPQGVDPVSQGMFVGAIISRTKATGADLAPPTTFVLSWHWNFTSESKNRCYVTGNFYTGR